MGQRLAKKGGFTLAELAIAVLLFGLVVGGLYTTFLMGRVAAFRARHQAQSTLLLQAKLEELYVGAYADVQNEGPTEVVIDPGADREWNTDDDVVGDLVVLVQDVLDLDGDGDTTEAEIDLDGDGTNDECKPVRVTLTWQSYSLGHDHTQTVYLDTLIAKR
jgi:prepilin-type N-terminal cleavage/methylation domain-containing protein